MGLLDYEKRFSALRMNVAKGNKSPHKVALLLAIIELIESRDVPVNQFYFDDNLKRHFTKCFERLASSSDRNNPHLPFFHLRSDGFWHHKSRPGRRESYQLNNLDEPSIRKIIQPERGGWDWLECELLVGDYVTMLEKQLAGFSYSKTEHRRALKLQLSNRSEGSIEFKHQNVSAVLLELGLPYIPGYKPAFNYQQQLKHVVVSYLAGRQSNLDDMGLAADRWAPLSGTSQLTWSAVFDPEPPEHIPQVTESKPGYLASRIDFSERERRNHQLGQSAEELVFNLEKKRLDAEGRSDLAEEVEWSSRERGDGLGYDIRSFDALREEERFLEVKATNSGKYQPFFISENERAFSNDHSQAFLLYRVYEFCRGPRVFILPGAIESHVQLLPQIYKARF
ncbi:DUF3883 domain-containing protein [Gilvimarinus sp. F26214L]|uniref:DUF3883 domain-containing protein n=1 Tax=Gilvimarinus sp. DZF01 TaxID=3461371 RepID=UPI0040454A2E